MKQLFFSCLANPNFFFREYHITSSDNGARVLENICCFFLDGRLSGIDLLNRNTTLEANLTKGFHAMSCSIQYMVFKTRSGTIIICKSIDEPSH